MADRRLLPDLRAGLEIVPNRLGADIQLKGACSMVLRRSPEDPALLRQLCRQHTPSGEPERT